MAVIASAQHTIRQTVEPIVSDAAPENPGPGDIWLDTSQSPPQWKVWIVQDDQGQWASVGDAQEALDLAREARQAVDAAKDEVMDAVGDAIAQITLTADEIRSEVKRTYADADALQQLRETVSTISKQTEDNFTWSVSRLTFLEEDVANAQEATDAQIAGILTYMSFGEEGLTIGKSGNPLTFRVVNDRLGFYMNGTEVAYFSNNKLYVTQADVLSRLQIGKFAFEPQANGNMSLLYTG